MIGLADILAEDDRRAQSDSFRDRVLDTLTPGFQRDLFLDKSKLAAAIAPRGVGKTWGLSALAFYTAYTGGHVIFVGKTMQSILASALECMERFSATIGVPMKKLKTEDHATIGSGIVRFAGADHPKFKDNLRGSRWNLIVVDELGHWYSDAYRLMNEVLVPMTLARKGVIRATGTPTYVPEGLFYDLTREDGRSIDGWSVHRCNDPLYSPHSRDEVRQLLEMYERQYGPDWARMPFIQREVFGRWVSDIDKLAFKFDPRRNTYKRLPGLPGDESAIGIGWGYQDRTGLAEVVWNESRHKAAFIKWAKVVDYGISDLERLSVDLGKLGRGKRIVYHEDYARIAGRLSDIDSSLRLVPTQKVDDLQEVGLFNTDLRGSKVLARRDTCERLIWEFERIDYLTASDGSDLSGKPKPNPDRESECTQAVMCAWHYSGHRRHRKQSHAPKPGTPEFYRDEASRMLKRRMHRNAMMRRA